MTDSSNLGSSPDVPQLSEQAPSRLGRYWISGGIAITAALIGYFGRMLLEGDVSDKVHGYQPKVLQVQPANLQTPGGQNIGGLLKVEGLPGLYVVDGNTKSLSRANGLFYEIGKTGGLENVVVEFAQPNGSINVSDIGTR